MPYSTTYIEPELFLEHNGVFVYHCYKNDELEDGVRDFCFVLDPSKGETDEEAFDVRELSTWSNKDYLDSYEMNYRQKALKEAIDKGELTAPVEE